MILCDADNKYYSYHWISQNMFHFMFPNLIEKFLFNFNSYAYYKIFISKKKKKKKKKIL